MWELQKHSPAPGMQNSLSCTGSSWGLRCLSWYFSKPSTFPVDYKKSIPRSWSTGQISRSNSQLIISLEAGKPQEGGKKPTKVSQEKLFLWKNPECTEEPEEERASHTIIQGPQVGTVPGEGAVWSCTRSRKKSNKPEIMVKLFARKRSCYKYKCRGIERTGRKTASLSSE